MFKVAGLTHSLLLLEDSESWVTAKSHNSNPQPVSFPNFWVFVVWIENHKTSVLSKNSSTNHGAGPTQLKLSVRRLKNAGLINSLPNTKKDKQERIEILQFFHLLFLYSQMQNLTVDCCSSHSWICLDFKKSSNMSQLSQKMLKVTVVLLLSSFSTSKFSEIRNLMDNEKEIKNQKGKLELEERKTLLMHN